MVEPVNTPFVGSWARNAISVWADFDVDGDLDLATFGTDPGKRTSTLLFLNPGNGELQPTTNVAYDLSWDTLLTGDFDHDNVPDLLFSGFAMGNSQAVWANMRYQRVARGRADLAMEPAEVGLSRPWGFQTGSGASWVDISNDGTSEVVLWGNIATNRFGYAHRTLGFIGTAGGPFEETARLLLDYSPSTLAWADFDRDGDRDLFSTMRDQGGFRHIFLNVNNQTGQLSRVELGLPGGTGHLSVNDIDQDGWPDVLLLANVPRLFRNTQTTGFVEITNNLPQSEWSTATWGDLDNDGREDVILTVGGSTVAFRHLGNGQFAEVAFTFPAVHNANVALGDADGDGDLDVLLGDGDHFDSAQYLCRNTASSNTAPGAPTGLAVTLTDTGLNFHWNGSSDAETAASALTYNVRVGTAPGRSDVVSALANPNTGQRLIVGPGNAGTTRFLRLNYLPRGPLFWSVQAVDAAFAGGAFAPEQVFQESPPVLSSISNLAVEPNLQAGPFAFTVWDAQTSAEQLRFKTVSLNESLIASTNVFVTLTGTNASLWLAPTAHQAGTAEIILLVSDAQGERSGVRFVVTVPEEFTLVQTNIPALTRGSAAWGDADGDGDLDLLTAGFFNLPFTTGSGRTDLWRNDGGVLNSNAILSLGDGGAGALAFIDANRDGQLDFSICGGTNFTSLFLQGPPGAFSPAPVSFAGVSRASMAWGDRDGDGDLDLVLGGNVANQFISDSRTWLYNNVLPTDFSSSVLLATGLRDGSAEWVDVDNDGDNDLFLTGSTTWNPTGAQTLFYLNNNGTMSSVDAGLPNVSDSSAAFADIDLDGDPDLALCGRNFGTAIFLNNGTGQFSSSTLITNLPAYAFGSLAWADFDNDRDPDLLISGIGPQDYRTELWHNENGVLVRTGNGFNGHAARGVSWGDLDDDGDVDLALAGSPDDGYSPPRVPYFTGVFRNDVNVALPPLPAPTGLTSFATGAEITLSWHMPTGTAAGLSYNVRVGTTPLAGDVMSAPADAMTGKLSVPARGNAGWSGRWKLRNLPNGIYYWSVQAIDAGFHASPFAYESSFSIPFQSVNSPRIMRILRAAANEISLHASGPAGRFVFVETSPDLQVWTTVATIRFDNRGLLQWSGEANGASGFIRLRQP